MKIGTDDYEARIRWWAAHPRIVALPPGPPMPRFRPQRFNSHAEMNAWKERLLREMAARTVSPHG